MTVEVLGTVIGTAIQGQIVGQAKAPCLQDQNGTVVASEVVNRTQSTTSLKDTVRPLVGQGLGREQTGCLVFILQAVIVAGVHQFLGTW